MSLSSRRGVDDRPVVVFPLDFGWGEPDSPKTDQVRTAGDFAKIQSSQTNPAESAGLADGDHGAQEMAPGRAGLRPQHGDGGGERPSAMGRVDDSVLREAFDGGDALGTATDRRQRSSRFAFLLDGMPGILQAAAARAARPPEPQKGTFQLCVDSRTSTAMARYCRSRRSASRMSPRPVPARAGSSDSARSRLLSASSGLSRDKSVAAMLAWTCALASPVSIKVS